MSSSTREIIYPTFEWLSLISSDSDSLPREKKTIGCLRLVFAINIVFLFPHLLFSLFHPLFFWAFFPMTVATSK